MSYHRNMRGELTTRPSMSEDCRKFTLPPLRQGELAHRGFPHPGVRSS